MNLKILLPHKVFADVKDVMRIVAETPRGSFGLLPNRLDCVSVLGVGILVYETDSLGEQFVAIDEGTLVKAGTEVTVSVRNAIGGADLGKLKEAVDRELSGVSGSDKSSRVTLAKLESSLVRQLMELKEKQQ